MFGRFAHKSGVDLDSGRSNLAVYVRKLMSYAAKVIANLEISKCFDGCASFPFRLTYFGNNMRLFGLRFIWL